MIPSVPGASLFAAIRGTKSFAPLRQPLFAALWTASLVSSFGSLIQSTGASWMMTELTNSAHMVALVQTATALPILMFSLLAGAIADIYERRLVMLLSLLTMMVASFALSGLAFAGLAGPWTLLVVTFVLGVGAALYSPAWQSSVAEQVSRDEMPAAVALNSLNYNLARALGPAVGGLIVAWAGAQAAFLANAVSYFAILFVLFRWKPAAPTHSLPPENVFPAVFSGLRYARQSPGIRIVLLRVMIFGLAGASIWALLPFVAAHIPGGGPLTYGLLLGALGLGAITGALTITPARHRFGNEKLARIAVLTYGLAACGTGLFHNFYALAGMLVAAGVAWVWALSTFNITVQMMVPRWIMGRTLSIYQMALFGGMALGSWLWGWLAEQVTPGGSLVASGGLMVLGVALAVRMPLPIFEGLDLEPSDHWPEPSPAIDMAHEAGPIRISLEYRVKPANVQAFLDVMRRVRRMRRRDGALTWSLLQDMAQPEIWLESFQVATWADHLRQQKRATMADRAVEAAAFALHSGPARPRIRYLIDCESQMVDAARVARDVRRASAAGYAD